MTAARLFSFALLGADGRTWYRECRDRARYLYRADADLYLRLFAVTSVNCEVRSNGTLARKALKQIRGKRAIRGFLGTVIEDIHKVRRGELPDGPKVQAFTRNLLGDSQAVTIDRWICRAFGRSNNKDLRQADREWMDGEIRHLASNLGWTPAETQAAIWTGIRRAYKQNEIPVREIIR